MGKKNNCLLLIITHPRVENQVEGISMQREETGLQKKSCKGVGWSQKLEIQEKEEKEDIWKEEIVGRNAPQLIHEGIIYSLGRAQEASAWPS